MKLQECLDHLATGELANTSFVDDDQIKDIKVEFIIQLCNEALIRLYSKFVLKEDYVLIELNELKTTYVLSKEHVYTYKEDVLEANNLCVEDYDKYIFETQNHPFKDNIIKIIKVVTSGGKSLSLNNSEDPLTVYTPSYNSIQLPLTCCQGSISVTYQAKHPLVSLSNLEQELELPEAFYGAFFAYITYLAYSSMQSENAIASAQKYLALYQSLLSEIVTNDLSSEYCIQTGSKFIKNGWC